MKGETIRYSMAFKQKVVNELESGKFRSLNEAAKIYGIGGTRTIRFWVKKLGRNHLLNKVVRVEMKDEKDRIKELEKEKQRLESALAQSQLKIITLESLVEAADEEYNTDLKKNFGQEARKRVSGK
ncbi:IS630 transposase-related protein [Chlamydiota bacterium]